MIVMMNSVNVKILICKTKIKLVNTRNIVNHKLSCVQKKKFFKCYNDQFPTIECKMWIVLKIYFSLIFSYKVFILLLCDYTTCYQILFTLQNELDMVKTKQQKGSVKYVIHTKPGPGPLVLDQSESLVNNDGLPKSWTFM